MFNINFNVIGHFRLHCKPLHARKLKDLTVTVTVKCLSFRACNGAHVCAACPVSLCVSLCLSVFSFICYFIVFTFVRINVLIVGLSKEHELDGNCPEVSDNCPFEQWNYASLNACLYKFISNLKQQNIWTDHTLVTGKPIIHTLHIKRTKNRIPGSQFQFAESFVRPFQLFRKKMQRCYSAQLSDLTGTQCKPTSETRCIGDIFHAFLTGDALPPTQSSRFVMHP